MLATLAIHLRLPACSPLSAMPLIQMLAPTSPNERMEAIARNAKGFIYLVSVTGVTGARTSISEGLGELIARVREHTSAPVCVGFGVGKPSKSARWRMESLSVRRV